MKQIELTLGLQALLTFKEMKNQHYHALGEFVDNSIQSYLDNKDALIKSGVVPSCIVKGRLGGSAITVAAVNALASRVE